jgi:hypothetical protein
MAAMPRVTKLIGTRAGAFGVALTVWDIWQRIPPEHRHRLLAEARRHGPRLAKRAYDARPRGPRPS